MIDLKNEYMTLAPTKNYCICEFYELNKNHWYFEKRFLWFFWKKIPMMPWQELWCTKHHRTHEKEKGWHEVLCKCKHQQGIVIHYGGKRKIPICPSCKDTLDECIDCYLVNRERKKAGQPPLKRGRDYIIDKK